MTQANDRLDRLERPVESGFSDFLISLQRLAERQSQTQQQVDALAQQQNQTQQQVDALAQAQRNMLETQRSMMQSMERLANIQAETSERLASIGAAVERLEQIADYLIRKDSER